MNDAPELRRVTADGSTTFHAEHDWLSDDELSDTIVAAVASVTETDPTELSPLYEVVDPDSLNRLFAPTPAMHLRPGGGCLTFSYNDCLVTAYWDGDVEIEPPEGERERTAE